MDDGKGLIEDAGEVESPDNAQSEMKTLQNPFLTELADTCDTECRLVSELPKMADAATSNQLKETILARLEETKGQVTKVGEVSERFDTMKIHPEAQPPSVNACLADYLCEHKDPILSEWRGCVRRDTAILPPKSLSNHALTNRLPEIVDDLTATLRHYGSVKVAEQAVKNAEEHGATRLMQGYELPEVLRELKHLRALLIYHLRIFEDTNPDNGMAALLFVSSTLHRFLDEVSADAANEFLWSRLSPQDRVHRRRIEWEKDQTNRPAVQHAGASF